MFSKSSRYKNQKIVDAVSRDGRAVKAISIRRLPNTEGKLEDLKGNDRLDIIAQKRYDDSTMFWHIADANTELDSLNLIKEPDKQKTIRIP